jgi:hypothetical protein
MKTLTFLLLFLVSYQNQPTKIDKGLYVIFPCAYKDVTDAMEPLMELNNNIFYVATLTAEGKKQPVLFAASKYILEEKMHIDSVFSHSSRFKPDAGGAKYKLVNFGKYTSEGRTFRYKISSIDYGNGKEIINMMYYLSKDDLTDEHYQFKMSVDKAEMTLYKKVLEKLVRSVEWRNQ